MKKISINKNNFWTEIFVKQLSFAGVKYACISPGSRSTPLTFAFANNKKIQCYVNIDERSSAFFALGLAKASKTPVAIVTTSGTAAAELYPAIIEAYQHRVPLIICTADRPPEFINTGANQTINQTNLYKNHIRWFKNIGLPSNKKIKLRRLQQAAVRAVEISTISDCGPVHLNFPFRKPLEPFAFDEELERQFIKYLNDGIKNFKPKVKNIDKDKLKKSKHFKEIIELVTNNEKGIIISGPMNFDNVFIKELKNLSILTSYPILADASSHLRFNIKKNENNVFSNYNAFLLSSKFSGTLKPKIILQFGRTPTSTSLEEYLKNCDAQRYLINEFGDLFDPLRKVKVVIKFNPGEFIKELTKRLSVKNLNRINLQWQENIKEIDSISEKIKTKIISKAAFPNEPGVITNLIKALPNKAHLVIGNSSPIRDFDNFVPILEKELTVHFNRGASGIDGITSTALGIAQLMQPAFLLTGDLSFLHDLNSLAAANNYPAGLTVILINNNGGGIFNSLPVSKSKSILNEYFITPHNLNLKKIITSFVIDYKLLKSWNEFNAEIKKSGEKKVLNIIEIKTDAEKSQRLRNKYFTEVVKQIDNEYKV